MLVFFKVSSGGLMLLWSIVKITARFLFSPAYGFFITAARVVVFVSLVSLHPRIIFIIILGSDSLCD